MKISNSGFHNITEESEKTLIISKNTKVVLFDRGNCVEKILLEEGAKVEYFGYFGKEIVAKKHIITQGENSEANVNCFLNAQNEQEVTVKVHGEVAQSLSKIDIDIVSMVSNGGKVDIDGIIQINEKVEKVEGFLDETNIFLGDKGSVRGFPTLLVRSNDVKAGHGCNIEKISDEKLFYLRSRGITKDDSIRLMIQSYIETIFSDLETIDSDFHAMLVNEIIESI